MSQESIDEYQLDHTLISVLACPAPHHAAVRQEGQFVVCTECGLRFPIRDQIPIMLLDEAVASA